MHLPAAMLERLRVGLGKGAIAGAIMTAALASGCASTRQDTAQAPFAGMGARANPQAPTMQVIAPGTTPFAQPAQPVHPVQPVAQPVAQPEPVSSPIVAPPVAPSRTWECGPCGMG